MVVAKKDGCFGALDKKSIDMHDLLPGEMSDDIAKSREGNVILSLTASMFKIRTNPNRKRRCKWNNPIQDLYVGCLFNCDGKVAGEERTVFNGINKYLPFKVSKVIYQIDD